MCYHFANHYNANEGEMQLDSVLTWVKITGWQACIRVYRWIRIHLVVVKQVFLQPPKYLIIVVNRFRYINNNFTKDRCSIHMDMTVVLGLHKFSLQATIDHHGPSMYSGHHTAFMNCCKRAFYCNDSKITEFKTIDTKNSSTAYVLT